MRLALGLAALLLAALPAPITAQQRMPLELSGYVKREIVTTRANGERIVELADPEVVVPGDRLIFGTRFTNTGTAPVEDFVISNPVPTSVMVAGGVDPAQIVSVDGGQTWGPIATRTVVADAGAENSGERRAAMPGDITHMRWIIPTIAPGASGHIEFAVTVR